MPASHSTFLDFAFVIFFFAESAGEGVFHAQPSVGVAVGDFHFQSGDSDSERHLPSFAYGLAGF